MCLDVVRNLFLEERKEENNLSALREEKSDSSHSSIYIRSVEIVEELFRVVLSNIWLCTPHFSSPEEKSPKIYKTRHLNKFRLKKKFV